MDDEELSDRFLSFIHDKGGQAKELCRKLKKLLHKKKRRLRRKKK
jgi:Flp pilus assembly protein TadB